jgi:hypothetical protein
MRENKVEKNKKRVWESPNLLILSLKKTKSGDQEWDVEDDIYFNPLS